MNRYTLLGPITGPKITRARLKKWKIGVTNGSIVWRCAAQDRVQIRVTDKGATLLQNQDAAPVAHPTTKALARSGVPMRLPWTSIGAWHKHGMDVDDKTVQASGAANGNSFALRSPGVKLMANSEHVR